MKRPGDDLNDSVYRAFTVTCNTIDAAHLDIQYSHSLTGHWQENTRIPCAECSGITQMMGAPRTPVSYRCSGALG